MVRQVRLRILTRRPSNQSMKPMAPCEMRSVCLPRHPAVAYLCLVRLMLRALKVALAVVIPAVAIYVVIFWTARGPFTASLVPWFAGYLLVIAAPQLMVLAIGARR